MDSYYNIAQEACKTCKTKVMQLRLNQEERDILLNPPTNYDVIAEQLDSILEDKDKSKQRYNSRPPTRSRSFVSKYSDLMNKVCALTATLLPLNKDFGFLMGMLVVLFRAVVAKRDREESLSIQIDAVISKLPNADKYTSITPNNACRKAVARLYVVILDYAEVLLLHFRPTRTGKLIEVLISPAAEAFDDSLEGIESMSLGFRDAIASIFKPETEADGGTRAMSQLFDAFDKTSQTLTASLETLDKRISALETQTSQMHKFTMTQHALGLKAAVMANPMDIYWDPDECLDRVTQYGFRLGHGDHWENNGVLDSLTDWRDHPQGPLMWISGPSATPDPWVSQLSVDSIHALKLSEAPCFYVLCSDVANCQLPVTATRVLRNLICQMLEKKPQVAFSDPAFFTTERMQRAVNFLSIWTIFQRLVEELAVDDVFVLIDRVDLVQPDEISSMNGDVLPALARLVGRLPRVRSILTSSFEPPAEAIAIDHVGLLELVFIDTTRPRLMQ